MTRTGGASLSAVGTVPDEVPTSTPSIIDVDFNGIWICRDSGIGEDRALVDLFRS